MVELGLEQVKDGLAVEDGTAAEAHVGFPRGDDGLAGVNIKRATLRTVLRRILGDVNLAYIVKDEAIQVVTPARARETLSTRTYYVGDLAGTTDIRLGPFLGRLQAAAQIDPDFIPGPAAQPAVAASR